MTPKILNPLYSAQTQQRAFEKKNTFSNIVLNSECNEILLYETLSEVGHFQLDKNYRVMANNSTSAILSYWCQVLTSKEFAKNNCHNQSFFYMLHVFDLCFIYFLLFSEYFNFVMEYKVETTI